MRMETLSLLGGSVLNSAPTVGTRFKPLKTLEDLRFGSDRSVEVGWSESESFYVEMEEEAGQQLESDTIGKRYVVKLTYTLT